MMDSLWMQSCQAILCLNGDVPGLYFWDRLKAPIFACDGAMNALHALGLQTHRVFGDGDSISAHLMNEQFVHLPDQNATDFEKSLQYLLSQGIRSILVVGIHGGDIDHSLYNIRVFVRYAPRLDLRFYDHLGEPAKWGIVLAPGIYSTALSSLQNISLLPYPQAVVTTQGLVWELEDSMLRCEGLNSVRNRNKDKRITITVKAGMVLCVLDECPDFIPPA